MTTRMKCVLLYLLVLLLPAVPLDAQDEPVPVPEETAFGQSEGTMGTIVYDNPYNHGGTGAWHYDYHNYPEVPTDIHLDSEGELVCFTFAIFTYSFTSPTVDAVVNFYENTPTDSLLPSSSTLLASFLVEDLPSNMVWVETVDLTTPVPITQDLWIGVSIAPQSYEPYGHGGPAGGFFSSSYTYWPPVPPVVGTSHGYVVQNNYKYIMHWYPYVTVRILDNTPPVADAGEDQTAECTCPCGTPVTLDGTGSYDPDGDPLSFEWSVPFGSGAVLDFPNNAITDGLFPIGETAVSLTVTDGNGGVATDQVVITVTDTTPPLISVSTDVSLLWPPNHQMIPVSLALEATEACTSPMDLIVKCTIVSNEPDDGTGDGSSVGDVNGDDGYIAPVNVTMTYDGSTESFNAVVGLRAERDGSLSGRTYSIIFEVEDLSQNKSTASSVIIVPHDKKKKK